MIDLKVNAKDLIDLKIDLKATGDKIYSLRTENDLSVARLAELLDLESGMAVYKWQNGKCLPSIENLMKMSYLFHVNIEDIIQVDVNSDMNNNMTNNMNGVYPGGSRIKDAENTVAA